ncbi:MAG TPA: hypothetical protein VG406_07850 [Isosphaeraceae bacterium]|jgi:hypothetical protein|nr:hypothetical protein [Isosphaeraceae bacterium]
MARRRKPELKRPVGRYRKTYALGVIGLIATLLVIAAWQSRSDVIHVRLVNRSGVTLNDLWVEQGDRHAEAKKWGPDQAIALDVKPRVVVPVMVRFASPNGDIFVSQYRMWGQPEVPLPGDSYVITVYGVGKDPAGVNTIEVVPEVVKDESPLRRVRWLFGW